MQDMEKGVQVPRVCVGHGWVPPPFIWEKLAGVNVFIGIWGHYEPMINRIQNSYHNFSSEEIGQVGGYLCERLVNMMFESKVQHGVVVTEQHIMESSN